MLRAALVALLATAATAVLPTLAAAQPLRTPATPVAPAGEGPIPEKYNPDTALVLSLGGTIGSYALWSVGVQQNNDGLASVGAIGTAFAPSFGHWYSGHIFTRGMGLRVGGVVAVGAGAMMALSACPLFAEDSECHDSPVGVGLMLAGAAAWVVGSADDIITAPGAARRANRAAAGRLTIAPVVTSHQTGLALAGTF